MEEADDAEDAKTEKKRIWSRALLLLQKVFTQNDHEAKHYSVNQVDGECIASAKRLIEPMENKDIPMDVTILYDHWRRKQSSVSLKSWTLETEHRRFGEIFGYFYDFEQQRIREQMLIFVFENLVNYTDFEGHNHRITNNEEAKVEPMELRLQSTASPKGQMDSDWWRCENCWFKNGKQKVNGVWVRLCDSIKCGFCGNRRKIAVDEVKETAEKMKGTPWNIELPRISGLNGLELGASAVSGTISNDEAVESKSESIVFEEDIHSANKHKALRCSVQAQSTALCECLERTADLLLQQRRYLNIIERLERNESIADTHFFANELVEAISFEQYANVVIQSARTVLMKKHSENIGELMDSINNLLHLESEGIGDFGSYFCENGDRKEFLKAMKQRKRMNMGEAGKIFRKIKAELEGLAVAAVPNLYRKWLQRVNVEAVKSDYDHIVRYHVHSTIARQRALYMFFEDVVPSEDTREMDESVNGMDAEKLINDIHLKLCHHKDAQNDWDSLNNPVRFWDEDKLREIVHEILNGDPMVQSLIWRAIEKCKIRGDSFVNEGHKISRRIEDALKQILDVDRPDFCVGGKVHTLESLMSHWHTVCHRIDTLNYQSRCSLPEVDLTPNDEQNYGYPQIHRIFKQYFRSKGTECKSAIDLKKFAQKRNRKQLPDGFFNDAECYLKDRSNDAEKVPVHQLTLQKAYGISNRLEDCSVEEVITVFTFSGDSDDQKRNSEIDGVFQKFQSAGVRKFNKMENIGIWRQKIVEWIQSNKIDGKQISDISPKEMRNALVAGDTQTEMKKLKKLIPKLLRMCKESNVGEILRAEQLQQNEKCLVWKRVQFVLKRFHALSSSTRDGGTYPDDMNNFLGDYGLAMLQNDTEHIMRHKVKGRDCPRGEGCIHRKRAMRERQSEQCRNLTEKKKLFCTNSEDVVDFVAISLMDRLHCMVHHDNDDMVRGQDIDQQHLLKQFKKDVESAQLKKKVVYEPGSFIDYGSLRPMHPNLKEEIMYNRICTITEHQFNEHLKLSKLVLDKESRNQFKSRRAWKADEVNDVAINEAPRVEHVLCIKMYCNDDHLCKAFCYSFRGIEGGDGSATKEEIIRNHADNFYWFGRYLSCGIELFGNEATVKLHFYRGINQQFLFNHFSSVYEVPLSTTSSESVASGFATEAGLILMLSPKFKTEVHCSRYIEVGVLGLSEFDHEKERLVELSDSILLDKLLFDSNSVYVISKCMQFAGMTVLSIVNIKHIVDSKRQSYKQHIAVMLYFERIIEQNVNNRDHYYHGVIVESTKEHWIRKQEKYLIPVIRSHVTKSREHKVPRYIYDLFVHFCLSKTDFIDLSCIHDERQYMCKSLERLFFVGKPAERRMNDDKIKDMFPKLSSYRNEHGLLISVEQREAAWAWDDAEDDDDGAAPKGDDERKYPEDETAVVNEVNVDYLSKRGAKKYPGKYYKDQFDGRVDPRGRPTVIEFKWNEKITDLQHCDLQHLLYLLQTACELYRRRVIERNRTFRSMGRPDRYIPHIDAPLIITNLLKWYNENKDKNLFTGDLLLRNDELFTINDILKKVGGVKKGPATRIYDLLVNHTEIKHTEWTTARARKLKLLTWGLDRVDFDRKFFVECTVNDIIILFAYKGDRDTALLAQMAQRNNPNVADGVFSVFERSDGGDVSAIVGVEGWKKSIVNWIRFDQITGKKLTERPVRTLSLAMTKEVVPSTSDDNLRRQIQTACTKMLNICKQCPFNDILNAEKLDRIHDDVDPPESQWDDLQTGNEQGMTIVDRLLTELWKTRISHAAFTNFYEFCRRHDLDTDAIKSDLEDHRDSNIALALGIGEYEYFRFVQKWLRKMNCMFVAFEVLMF